MKAVIAKSDLVTLISKILSIVATKPAIPILANLLIEAEDEQLIISATDLTTSMRCYAEAKVIEEGAIALPARRFAQLVRELTSPQIKISTKNAEIAEITSGSSLFKLHGMSKEEFPALPDVSGALQVPVKPDLLKEMLSRASFSAAREDSRYVLNGTLLQVSEQKATFIATDGKRLSKVSTPIDLDASVQGAYILPLKAVEEMIKMLDDSEEEAYLSFTHDKIFLEYANHILITKLMSGQYPDVARVIPTQNNASLHLHREELLSLLRQISLFTSDTTHSVRFTFQNGQLKLSATSSDIGEGTVSMPVDYTGEMLEIAFNPFYFQDILRHSKDETVLFSISDSFNPGMVTDSTSAIFVIMPMRLNEAPTVEEPDNAHQDPALT